MVGRGQRGCVFGRWGGGKGRRAESMQQERKMPPCSCMRECVGCLFGCLFWGTAHHFFLSFFHPKQTLTLLLGADPERPTSRSSSAPSSQCAMQWLAGGVCLLSPLHADKNGTFRLVGVFVLCLTSKSIKTGVKKRKTPQQQASHPDETPPTNQRHAHHGWGLHPKHPNVQGMGCEVCKGVAKEVSKTSVGVEACEGGRKQLRVPSQPLPHPIILNGACCA